MNSDISTADELCNDSFKTDCSNKALFSKSLAMQVQNGKCVVNHQKSNFTELSHQALSQCASNEYDKLGSSGKENSVHGTETFPNTSIGNTSCASEEASDAPGQDVYDKNSWILYGDSEVSAKNSWVLYGSSESPPVDRSRDESNLMQNDIMLMNNKGRTDRNFTDTVSQRMLRDKDSTNEDIFSEVRPYGCAVCNKRFKLSHHLKEHMRIHTGEKPFPCSVCGEKFSRSHLLRSHQARHAQESFPSVGTIFPCSKCMKIFESPQHLARHEKNHNRLKFHKCDICNKQFTHQVLLDKHKLQHVAQNSGSNDNREEKMIKQEPVNKESAKSDLPKNESPEECKKDFQDNTNICPTSLSEHLTTNDNNPQLNEFNEHKVKSIENKPPGSSEKNMSYDENPWVVYGENGNAKTAPAGQESHVGNAELDRNTPSVYKGIDMVKLQELYLATNRSLFNRNGLMAPFYGMFGFHRHALMSLIDQAAANNSVAPLSYLTGQNLKSDSPKTDESRPHQCPHCSKRFKLSHHLREHLRIHTGEKPYQCDVCHERFSRSHLLQRHKTKHVSDYTFHQGAEWHEKAATNGDCNQVSEPISMPYDVPETENTKEVGMNKSPAAVSNSVTSKRFSSNEFKPEIETGKIDSGSKPDGSKNQNEHKENTALESFQSYQSSKSASENVSLDTQGKNNKGNSIDEGAFPKSSCTMIPETSSAVTVTDGTSMMNSQSEFVSGDGELKKTTDSLLGQESRHPMEKQAVTFPGTGSLNNTSDEILKMDHQFDSMTKSFSTNSHQSQRDIERQIPQSVGYVSKSTGEILSHRKLDDEQDCEMTAADGTSKSEKQIHAEKKSQLIPPSTVQSKTSSEAHLPNYNSTFQISQSLLNNNINVFNAEYLNYTQGMQQALVSHTLRGFHNSDSQPHDIPTSDQLQDALFTSLEYSNLLRSSHGGFLRCELCGKLFADMNNLRQHMISHSIDRQFSCHQCDKKFKRPHHLKEHMRIHTGEKPYVCDVCEERFSRSHILQRHRMKHSTTLMNDSYVQKLMHNICEQNGQTQSPEFVYDKMCSQDATKVDTAHVPASSDSDSDNKPNSQAPAATESDMIDSDAGSVKLLHSGYSQDVNKSVLQIYACRDCGKRFANSSNLRQHMVSHVPDRMYPCSICNKKFKRPHHLKEHSRTHTGEKPYECGHCGEKFQRSHLLIKHKERNHTQYMYSIDTASGASAGTSAGGPNSYIEEQKTDPQQLSVLTDPDENASLPGHVSHKMNTENYNGASPGEVRMITDADDPPSLPGYRDAFGGDQTGCEGVLCSICNKEFPSEMLLMVHKRTHPGDRPHQCGNCGKHFALQYLLEVHEKSCS